jgi:hypothetical protein
MCSGENILVVGECESQRDDIWPPWFRICDHKILYTIGLVPFRTTLLPGGGGVCEALVSSVYLSMHHHAWTCQSVAFFYSMIACYQDMSYHK